MISERAKRVVIEELGQLADRLHRQAELMEERYGVTGELPECDREAADYISDIRKELQRS